MREVRLRPARELAWGGPLAWLPDGSGVVVGVRADGWSRDARSAYEALERGPIVVQDSGDDFLSWDAVRMKGALMELALVSVPGGEVRVLAPEAPYQDVRVAEDGTHLTWTVATPLKTSYTRNAGTEYEIFRLELAPGAEPVSLVEKSERRVRPQFSPDGTRLAWADRGDVWMRAMDASGPVGDSAVKVTEGERTPLTEADTTKRSYSLDRWSPDGGALLLRAQDGYWTLGVDDAGAEGAQAVKVWALPGDCLLYTSPSPRDRTRSRMPSSA